MAKKFKTRSGEVERLADLLQCAVTKAAEILAERGMQSNAQQAQVLGMNAVKIC